MRIIYLSVIQNCPHLPGGPMICEQTFCSDSEGSERLHINRFFREKLWQNFFSGESFPKCPCVASEISTYFTKHGARNKIWIDNEKKLW